MMKVYLCLDDHGRYPDLLVIVAENKDIAASILINHLKDNEQGHKFEFYDIMEFDTSEQKLWTVPMNAY